MPNNKCVLIYSGGMDSFTLLHQLLTEGDQVYALSFHYGQRHSRELTYATEECKRTSVPHHIIDLLSLKELLTGSALTDSTVDMPHGHYTSESMKLTIVPNRNMIMLSIAIGNAIAIQASEVYFAAHAGDHAIYPDCRPTFVDAINYCAEVANYNKVTIKAPYLSLSKGDILRCGIEQLGLRVEDYARTWTCYAPAQGSQQGDQGDTTSASGTPANWDLQQRLALRRAFTAVPAVPGPLACGKCGACTERIEAFRSIGAEDPIAYRGSTEL